MQLYWSLVLGVFGVNTAGAFAAQSGNAAQAVLSVDSGNILITDSGYFASRTGRSAYSKGQVNVDSPQKHMVFCGLFSRTSFLFRRNDWKMLHYHHSKVTCIYGNIAILLIEIWEPLSFSLAE